jgi:hypothetical protein
LLFWYMYRCVCFVRLYGVFLLFVFFHFYVVWSISSFFFVLFPCEFSQCILPLCLFSLSLCIISLFPSIVPRFRSLCFYYLCYTPLLFFVYLSLSVYYYSMNLPYTTGYWRKDTRGDGSDRKTRKKT